MDNSTEERDIRKYKAILFDVGDTLLTRVPTNHEILKERFHKIGYVVENEKIKVANKKCELWVGEQILREINGAPRMKDDDFLHQLDYTAVFSIFDPDLDNINKIVADIRQIESDKQEWVLMDGVHEVLSRLKDLGFILAVVSNFNDTLPHLLEKFKLLDFFDDIIVSSLVGVEKPDPKIMHIACERIGVIPQSSLYIGDHPFDVLCAKQAGMDVIWICENNEELPLNIGIKPDYCINSIQSMIGTLI